MSAPPDREPSPQEVAAATEVIARKASFDRARFALLKAHPYWVLGFEASMMSTDIQCGSRPKYPAVSSLLEQCCNALLDAARAAQNQAREGGSIAAEPPQKTQAQKDPNV